MPRHHAREEAVTGGPALVEIERVAETGSTNADLLARFRDLGAGAAPRPHVLVAERQTAGRGRQGRSWQSAPGASLTFSLAWPLATADLSGLSLAVGVALAETLDPHAAEALRIGLKWPNDLWLVGAAEPEGRKLGGVLIETAPSGNARVAVIGVGLNLLEQRVDAAASGVAWLAEIDPKATTALLLERIVPALADALRSFEGAGFAAFAARFAGRDLLQGRPIRYGANAGSGLEGIAAGVSANGELLIRTASGGVERIVSGEVSVRLSERRVAPAPQRAPARTPC